MVKIDWSRVKAIVFDFDGTLYDKKNYPFHLIMANPLDIRNVGAERAVRKYMKDKDFETEEKFNNAFFELLAKRQKRSVEKTRSWYEVDYLGRFLKVLKKHYHAQPRVNELLEKLRDRDVKTAVFSDYPRTEERMEAVGLSPASFDFCFSAPDMGALKPAPRLMWEILSQMEVEGSEVLVVGDRTDTDGVSALVVDAQFVQIVRKDPVEVTSHVVMLWDQFVEEAMSVPMG
jgi:FMN phosphatase YigB (HAD superfamily)